MFGFGGGVGHGGGYNGAGGARAAFPNHFEEQYHCYPVSFQDKEHLEDGDKILLPSSALDTLARLSVEYPMLFSITNEAEGKTTHCGVLEFSAPEGSCYIPFWMMSNLLLEPGGLITIKNVSLPKANFVKLQPQSVDFLDISNPRAVLERQLRHFSCVTKGDQLCIPYNARKYYLEIREVRPADAACIIETDCNVDFDAPVGYEEHLRKQQQQQRAASPASSLGGDGALPIPAPMSGKAAPEGDADAAPAFVPFAGSGARLDGKAAPPLSAADLAAARAAAAERRMSNGSSGGGAAAANGDAAAQAVRPGKAPPAPARRFAAAGQFAKRKLQTGAFQGEGNKLS